MTYPPPPPLPVIVPPIPPPQKVVASTVSPQVLSKAPLSHKGRRSKGQRGEREVVDILQSLVSIIRARYGLGDVLVQRNQNQSWQGGPDLHGLEGFVVEVKYQEQDWNSAWWIQAVDQGKKFNGVPILFYRRNGNKWRVRMRGYVSTPRDCDQIEMDVDVSKEDFLSWFENAYAERCELEARNGV